MSVARRSLVLAPAVLWAAGLAAQGSDAVYARVNGLTGFEVRGFSFDSGIGVTRASQWHVPIAFVAPVGRRLSVDVSASYASSSITTGGGTETITGLTDTQVRLLYTLQRDRLAASLLFNLPTGQRPESTFVVTGAVGSNFLSFPVSGFGTAFGVTGGLAFAARAGEWNVGLAGSVRYLGAYEPFSDVAATYTPEMEGRLRAGLDRVVGARTRVLVGLTGSTFSTDEFLGQAAGLDTSNYKPGTRVIADLGLVHVVGRTTFALTAWDYYRLAGLDARNDTTAAATKENVLNVELRAGVRASQRVQVVPMVAFRQYNPFGYRGGRLYSGGTTVSVSVSDHVSAQIGGRFDSGWVVAQTGGFAKLTGYGASVLVRFQR